MPQTAVAPQPENGKSVACAKQVGYGRSVATNCPIGKETLREDRAYTTYNYSFLFEACQHHTFADNHYRETYESK